GDRAGDAGVAVHEFFRDRDDRAVRGGDADRARDLRGGAGAVVEGAGAALAYCRVSRAVPCPASDRRSEEAGAETPRLTLTSVSLRPMPRATPILLLLLLAAPALAQTQYHLDAAGNWVAS